MNSALYNVSYGGCSGRALEARYMGATSAQTAVKLPAFAMSLEQFRILLQKVRNEFPAAKTVTMITVTDGIEQHSYANISDFVEEVSELPDVLNKVDVYIGDGPSPWAASRSVTLRLRPGAFLERNEAEIKGPTKTFVISIERIIQDGFSPVATIQGRLRLRGALAVVVLLLASSVAPVATFTTERMTSHHQHGYNLPFIEFLVAAVLIFIFVWSDRLYFGAFPTTQIEIRRGPRRWPYETVVLLLGVVGLVLAAVPFIEHP